MYTLNVLLLDFIAEIKTTNLNDGRYCGSFKSLIVMFLLMDREIMLFSITIFY